MKKPKFYFRNIDAEICYTRDYFYDEMEEYRLTEMEVYEADPEIIGSGIFWCKEHEFCGDNTNDTCGNDNCNEYEPRNKISGVCKHHTHHLYTHGEKVTLGLT